MARTVVAVDVGSTSARAGLFDMAGLLLATASHPFATHRPLPHHAEHDSEEVWRAVCAAAREALAAAGGSVADVVGIAFDATCSLVMLDAAGEQVSVSTTGDDCWNTVMWADHRATAEAREITATGHAALAYIGGTMSPEMELPKLLWLKRHLPAAWRRYGMAMDLADFLTWRASRVAAVSACTVTCKWTYLNHKETGWQADLFAQIGLDDALIRLRIPPRATQLGARVGGLTAQAAGELGLTPGISVGVGLIDAHAGGLGVLGGTEPASLNEHLAIIAGTSTCHMAVSATPRHVHGVWGPYFGAMMPGLWLNEGGQSATGALLDYVLDWHAEGRNLGADRHAIMAAEITKRLHQDGPDYASGLVVIPDFNGNRSPLADPDLRGLIYGLDLDASFESLVRLYYATAIGIGYGTRHIIDALDAKGYTIRTVHLTGGHARNPLLVRLYANAIGRTIVLPREPDAVLLGTAMTAATAAGLVSDLPTAGRVMCHDGSRVMPDGAAEPVHDRGYRTFRALLDLRRTMRA